MVEAAAKVIFLCANVALAGLPPMTSVTQLTDKSFQNVKNVKHIYFCVAKNGHGDVETCSELRNGTMSGRTLLLHSSRRHVSSISTWLLDWLINLDFFSQEFFLPDCASIHCVVHCVRFTQMVQRNGMDKITQKKFISSACAPCFEQLLHFRSRTNADRLFDHRPCGKSMLQIFFKVKFHQPGSFGIR